MSQSRSRLTTRFATKLERTFHPRWWGWACFVVLVTLIGGCDAGPENSIGHLEKTFGRRGISAGRFQKPRAMAIDAQDQLYIVDMTARIQVFTPDGECVRIWQTPAHEAGRPTGLSIDRKGHVLVADTHYYRLLVYTPAGELLKIIGGTQGNKPGEFGLVTDAVEDSNGNLYISEYGEFDRIQKFAPDGTFLLEWGGHGSAPGEFVRPQNMEIDRANRIWVADACNHRIQVFDTSCKLLFLWGQQGSAMGELFYPYDLTFDHEGHLLVCEFGNHRVQKFDESGKSLGFWGHQGRGKGELHNPWAIVCDSQNRIYVLDTYNHRVQRFRM